MGNYKITVKEVNDYADSLNDREDIYVSVECFISEESLKRNIISSPAIDGVYYPDGYDYVCKVDIDETNGHLTCLCYDYEKYNSFIEDYKKWYARKDRKLSNMPNEIDEEFKFELPLTRGFSDSAKRCEVNIFSDLDVSVAVEEGINNHFGKSVLYPYQVKAMFGNDLDMEEEELDILIADMF